MSLSKLCRGAFEVARPGDLGHVTAIGLDGATFTVTGTAERMLDALDAAELVGLRRRIWEANASGGKLTIDSGYLERKHHQSRPPTMTLAMDLLRKIEREARPRDEKVWLASAGLAIDQESLMILCTDAVGDVAFYVRYLAGRTLVQADIKYDAGILSSIAVRLLPEGLIALEGAEAEQANNARAFVAMWFSPETTPAYQDAIEPAVRDAGYDAVRIDRLEHVNRIDDEILAQIRLCKFIISDFTSETDKPRGGVYFEAGFALGLGKPVIWTAKEGTVVHFDTRQYNHIFWKDEAELRERLHNRIIALLGVGPHYTGPATTPTNPA
jgi:nucleoside 2-deoxyribosyltransferase